MPDNTDLNDEASKNFDEFQFEKSTDENISGKEIEPINVNHETETMEVHHHPQVEKKSFKEYLLEGLMIFLAVTLGFFAESIRERIADNRKENEYIISMIEDAQKDSSNIQDAILLNEQRIYHLDTLAVICIDYDASKKLDAAMYRHYRFGLIHPAFISPTERTIQQLKSAGGMRLIRKKAAVESIINYDDMAKKLYDQQAYYELWQNKIVDFSLDIFNFQRFGFGISNSALKNFTDNDSSVTLLLNNKSKLTELGNLAYIYEGIVKFYNNRLKEMQEHAVKLIVTLRKEYHLENE